MHSYTMIPRRKESLYQEVVLKETVSSTPSDHNNQSAVDLEITGVEIDQADLYQPHDIVQLS